MEAFDEDVVGPGSGCSLERREFDRADEAEIADVDDMRQALQRMQGVLPVIGSAVGVDHCAKAARRLPRLSAESCVLVVKAAIWSRGTKSLGLYVVGVVPFVRPEKKASAIWQKNILPITSVNGTVVIPPPQIPVSAGRRLDVNNKMTTVNERTTAERNLAFIGLSFCN